MIDGVSKSDPKDVDPKKIFVIKFKNFAQSHVKVVSGQQYFASYSFIDELL